MMFSADRYSSSATQAVDPLFGASGTIASCMKSVHAFFSFILGLLCRVKGSEGERLRGGVLGLGLLMGGAVFAFGHSCGCKRAEILAIKDDGGSHLTTHQKA